MDSQIAHLSVDLWNTIIISNPEYQRRRNKFIFDNFNPMRLSQVEIDQLIKKNGAYFNMVHMMFNEKRSTSLMLARLLLKLGYRPDAGDSERTVEIGRRMNALFLEFPPLLIEPDLTERLRNLSRRFSLNISSNTGYIEGDTLESALRVLDIHKHFAFFVFSDRIKKSKPHRDFFSCVADSRSKDIRNAETLHVGDSWLADILGARFFGFQARLHRNNWSETLGTI